MEEVSFIRDCQLWNDVVDARTEEVSEDTSTMVCRPIFHEKSRQQVSTDLRYGKKIMPLTIAALEILPIGFGIKARVQNESGRLHLLLNVVSEKISFPTVGKKIEVSTKSSSTLEEKIEVLWRRYEEEMVLPNKLSALFAQDMGNASQPLRSFYLAATHKLTAFIVGVLAIESNLVVASDTWLDSFVHGIFTSLRILSTVASASTAPFFGAGAIIPLVASPVIGVSNFVFDYLRRKEKTENAETAGTHFQGEPEQVFHQIQCLAYGLTYLLQKQIPYCTSEGSQAIIDAWLYKLSYQVMHQCKPDTTKKEADAFVSLLLHMSEGGFGKHKIPTLATHPKLKWDTANLFKKAGVAYCLDGVMYYQSCHNHKGKELTEVKRYGYLYFDSVETALIYQQAVATALLSDKGVSWRADLGPQGPPALDGEVVPAKSVAASLADALLAKTKRLQKKLNKLGMFKQS